MSQYINLVLFVALAVVCLRLARRHRSAASRWAAITFGVLGVVVIAGLVVPEDAEGVVVESLVKLLILGILVYPYALYRFSAAFESLPRKADRFADIGGGVLAVATILLPSFPEEGDVRPAWFQLYAFAFLAYWTVLSLIVARRLWSAGRTQSRVSRNRMRTLALGAIGLAFALLPGLIPEENQPTAVRIFTLVLPVLSALLFYVGLAPPTWMRAVWRRPEEAALRRVELELVKADDRERVLGAVLPHAAALVGGKSAVFTTGASGAEPQLGDGTIRIPTADGALVVEAGPYAPFFASDELEMLRSLAGFLDLVLERTTLLDREREARADAERTNHELETLVYGISHDLKSPIISLLGYLEYLRTDYGDSLADEGRHYLDRMEKSAVYMQDLLGDLLELSRIGRVSVDLDEVDLGELLRDLQVDVTSKFPSVRVEVRDLPVLWMNRARARQLFTNLVENAARHGGRDDVTIRVFGAIRDDGSAVVSVADDGVGIPAEYREKAFGIFERLGERDSASGTGIGLALCRKIVESVGGSADIVDAPVGALVRLVFPPPAVVSAARLPVEVKS